MMKKIAWSLVLLPVLSAASSASWAHGRVVEPPSRIVFCTQGEVPGCKIAPWKANAMESGKFFPETDAGVRDKFAPSDTPNSAPPPDGAIASTSVNGNEKVLDEFGIVRWPKTRVRAGAMQDFVWEYSAKHKTRRWNYFITRQGWNPDAPLTRAQFESEPFCQYQNPEQPFWEHPELMPPDRSVHSCKLPERRGYHVILAVWEVADTPHAFYQQIDTYFDVDSSSLTSPFANAQAR